MRTFTGKDIIDAGQWFRDQKFPLFISEDSRCALIGRFIFFDQALLPGVSKSWGYQLGKRFGWNRWTYRVQVLDNWIYLKGKGREEARTIPFAWFVRTLPDIAAS